jgi:hypothetical protein
MKLHSGWLAAGLLLCALLACNLTKTNSNRNDNAGTSSTNSTSTAGPGEFIGEIRMAKDDGSGDPQDDAVTSFSPTDRTIHCVVKLKDADAGTKMKFSWWIIDAGGEKNEKIKEIDYTTRALENVVHGHLTLPQDWPKGKYKVDVYVNGNVDKTINYAVE